MPAGVICGEPCEQRGDLNVRQSAVHGKTTTQIAHARNNNQVECIASPFVAEYRLLCRHPAHCIFPSSRLRRDAPPKPTDSVEPFVLSITASLRRAGKGVRLVIGNGAAKAIDDGFARNMFLAGRDVSIDAMASRLGVRRDYVAALVRLS
jgi:hypothetical protein